ncbi:MAG: hypothetical protein WCD18_07170 [Thermosynechococcaceae cyanobacterium]
MKPAMAGKQSIWPLLLAAFVGGSVAFFLSQLQYSIWIEPSPSPTGTSPPVIEVSPDPVASVSIPPSPLTRSKTITPDGLRVSNQSPYAVRVVLLSHAGANNTDSTGSPESPYGSPVHWDFAPKEGGQGGLLLSLPEGNLKLASGDVLVAFALDGSRHYWGPYVVGQTPNPTRKTHQSEWSLVLGP